MTDKERFEKENEVIADIIQRGQFLNAKQGIQIGEWIAEGLTNGLTKHAHALADELDAIDNVWQCPNCNESNYDDYFAGETFKQRVCNACSILYDSQDIQDEELPTRLEGSD